MSNNTPLQSGRQAQPSPAGDTPVITWSPPWTYPPSPSRFSPVPIRRQSSLGTDHDQLMRDQEQRRLSLELLEVRSTKRSLELQHRQARRDLAELRDERAELLSSNASLEKDLSETRADLSRLRHEQRQLTEVYKKQAVLLSIERDIRRDVEEELERCREAIPAPKIARKVSWSDTIDEISNNSDSSIEPAPAEANGPQLHELLEQVRSTLTGTVSSWVKGMLAACAREIKEALILPWLLHKLFFLCSELIHDRREDLINVFAGGKLEVNCGRTVVDSISQLDASTAEFMLRHLRRHHLTLFPISRDALPAAVDKVMMALAQSMIDCKEWDPDAKNPEAVRRALAASGLEQIVREYLRILVYCCLQSPAVAFSDDLGQVERYDRQLHSEPIDGDPAGEFCVVIFPALIAASDNGRWGDEPESVSPRYVLWSEGVGVTD